MKIVLVSLFLLSISVQFVTAQPSQAEIDKMMKQQQELMKKYGNDSARAKAMKGLVDQQKQVSDAMKNQQANSGGNNSLYSADPGSYGNVDNWKFPVKNTALLGSLPTKVFTKTELVKFLNDLYSELSKILAPGIRGSVQAIAAKYNNDGNKMGDLALAGWYTDYREEALLLIVKAAANEPDNGILLNNCAALLEMTGIEQKAIPILKYVLQSYPDNSMLLNNLGQAYAGLGATDTAMYYLSRCMKIEPEHPEACNTAGQIEAEKGNKEKAIEYFEKSIRSAYTKTAELKLRKIKKGSKIVPLVRPRIKIPEYFNQFKYQLPAQCTQVENAAVSKAEHAAFRTMITKQGRVYGAKYAELSQKKTQEVLQQMKSNGAARAVRKNAFVAQPYYELCGIMARDIGAEYGKALADLGSRVDKSYNEEFNLLEKEYKTLRRELDKSFDQRHDQCCGEGRTSSCCPRSEEKCTAYNNLANQYLPKFALITEEWQKKNLLVFNTYFDELVYWQYLSLHPIGDDNFKIFYYVFIQEYLVMLDKIGNTMIIEPCGFTPTKSTKESNAIGEMDCPIDIELGIGVGEVQLNCETFSFSIGEGVIFGFEKNFKTKQSTLSFGVGVQFNLGVKAGQVEAKVSAAVNESIFISFDGDNKFSDGGLKFEAKATSGLGENIVKVNDKLNVGYTLGVNSGWNFNEGFLKGKLGPTPPAQQNKKVPIYKPKQG